MPRLHLIRTVPYNFVLKNTNLSSAATIEQISNWVSHSLHQEEKLCTDFNKIDIKEENTIELIRNKQRAEGKVTRAGDLQVGGDGLWEMAAAEASGYPSSPATHTGRDACRSHASRRCSPRHSVEAAAALDDESRPAAL